VQNVLDPRWRACGKPNLVSAHPTSSPWTPPHLPPPPPPPLAPPRPPQTGCLFRLGLTDNACHVTVHISDPRVVSYLASFDLARSIYQSLPLGSQIRRSRCRCRGRTRRGGSIHLLASRGTLHACPRGRAVQVGSIITRVESAYGFSTLKYDIQGLTLVHFSAQPKPCWSHLRLFPCLIDWGEIIYPTYPTNCAYVEPNRGRV